MAASAPDIDQVRPEMDAETADAGPSAPDDMPAVYHLNLTLDILALAYNCI